MAVYLSVCEFTSNEESPKRGAVSRQRLRQSGALSGGGDRTLAWDTTSQARRGASQELAAGIGSSVRRSRFCCP